jgi:peptidoglycan hydrolase-like protein with peptidoglycan-binding domain
MKRKIVVASIVLVVLILIFISSWLIYKKYIKKPIQDELPPDISSSGNLSGGGTSSTPVGIPPSFPLRKGMSGPMISDIQNAVNKKCNANLVPDGKFGPMTESATKSCYGATQVNETLYTQMKIDSTGSGCPDGQYKVPGIGCMKIMPTSAPVSNELKKGDAVVSRMPSIVLFSAPSGNTSIGKIVNLTPNKPIGVYELKSEGDFSKLWLNVSYVKNNGMLGTPPAWVYVYSSLIKKK